MAAENKAKVVNLSLGFQDDEADNASFAKRSRPEGHFVFRGGRNSGPQIREFPAACESPNMTSLGVVRAMSGYGQVIMPGDGSIGLTR